MKEIAEVTEYISKAPELHQALLIRLRIIISSIDIDVTEQFKWSRPVYAAEKDFCYLQFTKKHVTFGFMNFEKITDTNGLLEGTGKQMRHIKLTSMDQIDEALFVRMMMEAGS